MTPLDEEKFEQRVSIAADKAITDIFGWPWEPNAQRAYAACVDLVLRFESDLNAAYQRQRQNALRAIEETNKCRPGISQDWKALREWIEAKRLSLKADRQWHEGLHENGLQCVWISGQESLLDELAELIKEK